MRASSGFGLRLCCAATVMAFAAVSAQAAEFDLVPIRASGSHSISGNEITLPAGGQDVEIFVFVRGFAPQVVATYQATIDCTPIDGTGDITALSTNCNLGEGTFGTDYCLGVDESQPTYLLDNAAGTIPACQNVTLCPSGDPGAFACGSVALGGSSGPDNGGDYYGLQFAFNVGAGARGSYTISLDPDPNSTLIRDNMAREVPITGVIPAIITIPVGACCGDGGTLDCQDGLTESECGGAWLEGVTCTGTEGPIAGLDAACPTCDDNIPDEIECDDQNACTVDVCDLASGCTNTDTTPAGQCCNPSNGSLTMIDDGDPCTDDICNADGSVSHPPAAGGTACDDGNGCTAFDECDGAGGCAGTDINTIMCGDISECPAGSQSCEDGFCVCTLETKMDLVVAPSDKPDDNCFPAGAPVTVDVVMGAGSECVTGGQFLVRYDPTCLSFEGLSAGAFFPVLVYSDVDEAAGTVFAAVGVMPGGGCTQGPETLATLSFSKLDGCGECSLSYDSVNPQNTILTNDAGNSVPLTFNDSKVIRLSGDITLNAPEGETLVNPDCDTAVATVTWDPISASDSCDGAENPPTIECEAFHNGGVDVSDLATAGGVFPQGRSSFTCTATNSCGNTEVAEWTVEVSDQHSMDVEVQLSPVIVGDPLTRCICFDFYSDCVQAPTTWCQDLTFGFPYDFTGKSTASLKVPKGQYACITAKDPLHTLRSVSDIDCVGNTLVAEFKGDPEFDGNWLVNGNLDCWKADGNGDTIDILDFGMFISQYQQMLDPNTPCGTDGPHSDINGDGVVDGADFTFISMNFLANSKNSCCDDGAAAAPQQPITSITVKELRRRGLGELAVADLNGDDVVDQADMAAFMAGDAPSRTIKRGADAGSRSLGR